MTGLDLNGKQILENAIRKFAAGGGTVLWINHDIVQVNEIADTLTYIDRKVLLHGAPREVLASGTAAQLFPTLGLPQREVARA
jgi:zinc transport system ATP-binding protein